jgi:heat shock protein HtpX
VNMQAILEQKQLNHHRLSNFFQSLILFVSMLFLVVLISYLLLGMEGLKWAVTFGAVLLLIGIKCTPGMILKLYKAQPVVHDEIPGLRKLISELADHAKLGAVPQLYYVPSRTMNAFTVGNHDKSCIVLTDGLLRTLNRRELTGVLAHEITHIGNNDSQVMSIADMLSRMTSLLSTFGQLLLLINLPMFLLDSVIVPWSVITMMLFAPIINSLLQLALSKTREFDADTNAVYLTGDPDGLASALFKMEYYGAGLFEWLFLAGHGTPEPSLLRTHPTTEERMKRLKSHFKISKNPLNDTSDDSKLLTIPLHIQRVQRRPRWRIGGMWY